MPCDTTLLLSGSMGAEPRGSNKVLLDSCVFACLLAVSLAGRLVAGIISEKPATHKLLSPFAFNRARLQWNMW